MKEKMKRFLAGFLAMLTMFTTLFSNGTTAFAASPSANISFWYASVKDHGVVTGFSRRHTGGVLYAMIDGHSAYCMNFGLSASGGQLMTSDTNANTSMTAAQEKLLAYCMYYGYSSTENDEPNDKQKNEYIATQAMVWIIMEGLFGTDTANQAASDICVCAPSSSDSYSYYESLRNSITASYNATRPSFASNTKGAAQTELNRSIKLIRSMPCSHAPPTRYPRYAARIAPNARNITEGFFLLVCIGAYLFLCVVAFVAVLTLVSVST